MSATLAAKPSRIEVQSAITAALRRAYGRMQSPVKRVARAAEANEKAARNWWEGQNAPDATNLIALIAESDEVFEEVMRLAGRADDAKKALALAALAEIARKLGEGE